MSTSFSHSTRSLQEDNNLIARLGLVLASLLMLAWGIWFSRASIVIHETGHFTGMTQGNANSTVIATFPAALADRIHPGQTAQLLLDEIATAIPAVVMKVTNRGRSQPLQVEIYALAEDRESLAVLRSGVPGQVDLVVDQLSPASLLFRSARQLLTVPTGS